MYNLLVMSGVKNIERYQEYKNFKLDWNKKTNDFVLLKINRSFLYYASKYIAYYFLIEVI